MPACQHFNRKRFQDTNCRTFRNPDGSEKCEGTGKFFRGSDSIERNVGGLVLGCPTSIANGDGRAAPRLHLVQLGTGRENLESLAASGQEYLAPCCDRKVSAVIRSGRRGPAHGRGDCMALAPCKSGSTTSVSLLCGGRTVRFLFFKGKCWTSACAITAGMS